MTVDSEADPAAMQDMANAETTESEVDVFVTLQHSYFLHQLIKPWQWQTDHWRWSRWVGRH